MQKILIVDDEQDLREALHSALEAAGYEAVSAEDGEEGLSIAKSEHPDLILLDIQMPHKSGHGVLGELRRDAWGKDVPVLLLTNADDAMNIAEGVKRKSDDYIIKSQTSLEEIVKRVKQHLAGYHH